MRGAGRDIPAAGPGLAALPRPGTGRPVRNLRPGLTWLPPPDHDRRDELAKAVPDWSEAVGQAPLRRQTGHLHQQMARLPARPGMDDPVSPWNVREVILDNEWPRLGGGDGAVAAVP
jgi:hypothetical protein